MSGVDNTLSEEELQGLVNIQGRTTLFYTFRGAW